MNFINSAISNRGFGKNLVKLPKDNLPISITVGLILLFLSAKFFGSGWSGLIMLKPVM